jgi:hypothetical protein
MFVNLLLGWLSSLENASKNSMPSSMRRYLKSAGFVVYLDIFILNVSMTKVHLNGVISSRLTLTLGMADFLMGIEEVLEVAGAVISLVEVEAWLGVRPTSVGGLMLCMVMM